MLIGDGTPQENRLLRLWPGVGLVVANMIGAGVLLSTGFMAQDMGPGTILAAWGVGAVVALAGAKAYAAVSALIPRSGGEYRFLSELMHPAVGYAAGWTSLLVGFSAPIAVDAIAAGSFAQTLWEGLNPRWFGAGLVAVLTLLHAIGSPVRRVSAGRLHAEPLLYRVCLQRLERRGLRDGRVQGTSKNRASGDADRLCAGGDPLSVGELGIRCQSDATASCRGFCLRKQAHHARPPDHEGLGRRPGREADVVDGDCALCIGDERDDLRWPANLCRDGWRRFSATRFRGAEESASSGFDTSTKRPHHRADFHPSPSTGAAKRGSGSDAFRRADSTLFVSRTLWQDRTTAAFLRRSGRGFGLRPF